MVHSRLQAFHITNRRATTCRVCGSRIPPRLSTVRIQVTPVRRPTSLVTLPEPGTAYTLSSGRLATRTSTSQ